MCLTTELAIIQGMLMQHTHLMLYGYLHQYTILYIKIIPCTNSLSIPYFKWHFNGGYSCNLNSCFSTDNAFLMPSILHGLVIDFTITEHAEDGMFILMINSL